MTATSREIRFEVTNTELGAKPGELMRIPGCSVTVRVVAIEPSRTPDLDSCTIVAAAVEP